MKSEPQNLKVFRRWLACCPPGIASRVNAEFDRIRARELAKSGGGSLSEEAAARVIRHTVERAAEIAHAHVMLQRPQGRA